MPTLVLDSSVIIDVITGNKGRDQFLLDLIGQGNILACCSINITEFCAGMRLSEEARTTSLLQGLKFYPVTWVIARLAGELKYEHARKPSAWPRSMSPSAAVAIHHQLSLITETPSTIR